MLQSQLRCYCLNINVVASESIIAVGELIELLTRGSGFFCSDMNFAQF